MKSNPWPTIALSDYEGHMGTPTVAQSAMLAEEFAAAVQRENPRRVALVGCAGGNGLEFLHGRAVERVVCVDINPDYVATLQRRFAAELPGLDCQVTELEQWKTVDPVDLVFGGLVFEYTRLDEAVAAVSAALVPGGHLVALLQVHAANQQTVTPSVYAQAMSVVVGFFQYISPADFQRAAARHGLRTMSCRQRTLPSGKDFAILCLEKVQTTS